MTTTTDRERRIGLGVWLVDKPAGPTSHDVVARIRRGVGRGVKVGHTGTLDPFATGLLVVVTGKATRLTPYLTALSKRYTARIRLGATSPTGDPEGPVTETGAPIPDSGAIDAAVADLVGENRQRVPAYSAVKVDGVALHRRTRRGEVARAPDRTITITDARRIGSSDDGSWLDLDVTCSKGTYIRQLAADLGDTLGCGAYCTGLRRTAVGTLTVDDAVDVEAVPDAGYVNPLRAIADLPRRELGPEELAAVRHGQSVTWDGPGHPDSVALVSDDAIVAIGTAADDILKPRVVLV